MSLSTSGVWATGVWATTAWADGVWDEAGTLTGTIWADTVWTDGVWASGVWGAPVTTMDGTIWADGVWSSGVWADGVWGAPATGGVSVSLSGAEISADAGTVSIPMVVTLNGAQIAAEAQAFSYSDLTQWIDGAAIATGAGTLTVTGDAALSLTGAQIDADAGTLGVSVENPPVVDVTFTLATAAISSGAGTVGVTGAAAVDLTGAEIATGAGAIAGPQEAVFTITGAGIAALAGTLTKQADPGYTGGFAWLNEYDRERNRRAAEKQRRKRLLEDSESIEDTLTRDIALLLREQEEEDARQAELARLGQIAAQHNAIVEALDYSERVAAAMDAALAKGTYSALEALERELDRAREEEEFLIMSTITILNG